MPCVSFLIKFFLSCRDICAVSFYSLSVDSVSNNENIVFAFRCREFTSVDDGSHGFPGFTVTVFPSFSSRYQVVGRLHTYDIVLQYGFFLAPVVGTM